MRKREWFTLWRNEGKITDEVEQLAGRGGARLFGRLRNGWSRSLMKEKERHYSDQSTANAASPLAHGLF